MKDRMPTGLWKDWSQVGNPTSCLTSLFQVPALILGQSAGPVHHHPDCRTVEFQPHFHTWATSNHISLPRQMCFISLAAALVPAGVGRKAGTASDNPSAAKGKVPQPRDNPISPLSKGLNGVECPLSLL